MLSLNFSLPNMSVMISVHAREEKRRRKKDHKSRNKQDLKAESAAVSDLVGAALGSPGIAF